ncbi:MAG: GUN4 domain-containing protein [Cyanobacteria bacterium P01_A01_bin.114]
MLISMRNFWLAGLLSSVMLGGVADGRVDISAVFASSQTPPAPSVPPTDTASPSRYNIYLDRTFGFRFIYPEGYRSDSATAYSSIDPEDELQLSLDLWQDADYLPWGGRYQGQPDKTEMPPHISIEVWRNPEGRALRDWLDRAAASSGQVTTVAGQGAIAAVPTPLADVVVLPTPDGAHIVKLQADYLDETDPMRQVFQSVVASLMFDHLSPETEASTAARIDYSRLQTLLAEQSWQAADLETRSILMRLISNYDYLYPGIEPDGITALSCGDIQIMDALWSQHSDGQFGFKTQARLWQSLAAVEPQQRAEQLGQQVGWRRQTPLPEENLGLTLAGTLWRLDTDITYEASAPMGHLPWPGVSSLVMERMIQESGAGCGSCTIDAMYMSSDRFADYLDAFLTRVDDCLCSDESVLEQATDSP